MGRHLLEGTGARWAGETPIRRAYRRPPGCGGGGRRRYLPCWPQAGFLPRGGDWAQLLKPAPVTEDNLPHSKAPIMNFNQICKIPSQQQPD